MSDLFLKADFHVHSPASRDYQPVAATMEQEYSLWVDRCITSGLELVAITDHNSFSGFLKVKDILAERRAKLDNWSELRQYGSFPPEMEGAYSTLVGQVSQAERLWLIPGVELEPHEGFHLLVLFPSDTEPKVLARFLEDCGVKPEDDGRSVHLLKTSLAIMDSVVELGGIAILAHVDSDNGAYNVLKNNGSGRALVFAHEGVCAIQYKSEVTADKIRSILQAPEYRRSTRLAFVKGSDFHNKEHQGLGDIPTYVGMNSEDAQHRDFSALKGALRNPDERISAGARPEVQEVVSKLGHDSDVLKFESIEDDQSKVNLARAIAALTNSSPTDPGRILVGVSPQGNKTGLRLNFSEFQSFLRQATSMIKCAANFYLPEVLYRKYDFAERYFVSMIITKRPGALSSVNGDIMTMRNGEVAVASPAEIKHMVEEELNAKYHVLSTARDQQIAEAIRLLEKTDHSLLSLKAARKLERFSLRGTHMLPMRVEVLPDSIHPPLIDPNLANGVSEHNGNLLVPFHAPSRQEGAYMRFLAPMTTVPPEQLEGLPFVEGSSIFVTARGACYWVPRKMAVRPMDEIAVASVDERSGMSAKAVLAFLNSSLSLWYRQTYLGTAENRELQTVGKLPIPILRKNDQSELESVVDQILRLETAFLELSVDKQREETDNHNQTAAGLIAQLDLLLFQAIGLDSEEIDVVRNTLDASGIWIPRLAGGEISDNTDA